MRYPDFFIVGAPKCGTSSMDDYLNRHPQIVIPGPKEMHFFGSDLEIQRRMKKDEYLAHFAKAGREQRVGEDSVWYLISKRAAAEIHEVCPDARIVIMLRNPVEMLPSLHSQFLFNTNENLTDFESALNAEEDRKNGVRTEHAHFVQGLFYRETVQFAQQVKRYFDVFGRERVHVVIFDEFTSNTPDIYRETLRFLDVDVDFQPSFRVRRQNKSRRRIPPLVQKVAKRITPRALHQFFFWTLGVRYEKRKPIDAGLKKRLQSEFAPEIERLSNLLGKELTYWSKS